MRSQVLTYGLRLLCTMACLLICPAMSAPAAANTGLLLNIQGPIGPATQSYIENGIDEATKTQATLIILQLDTPGGLATSMHNIDKALLNSSIPVITYVAPQGARAASAGTFMLYASTIAAMAPGTNLGAASPVSLISPSSKPGTNPEKKLETTNLSTTERKQTNDAAANIVSLAEIHGRNASWAETAVREAVSLPASDALRMDVIDVIAKDLPDLLRQLNGRIVNVNGLSTKLNTIDITMQEYKPDWRYRFLSVITDPNIAYILLLIGIYGLFFEFYHPGLILPGVVGAIALLLALYSFQLLPINYVGFSLLLLGITFMIIEILISSLGILGIGGIIAFVTGSILLLDIHSPGYQIAWSLILTMTIFTVGFFLLIVTLSIRAMRKKIITGHEAMIGAEGEVIEYAYHQWHVRINGEIWQAKCATNLKPGQKIRVLDITGLVLTVEPAKVQRPSTSKINE
jgi:membrane-bound serine protease (ClpP class)